MNKKSLNFIIVAISVLILIFTIGIFFQRTIEEKIYSTMPTRVRSLINDSINNFVHNEIGQLHNRFSDEFRTENNGIDKLKNLRNSFKNIGEYKSKKIIGYNFSKSPIKTFYKITHEIKLSNTWLITIFIIDKIEDSYKITSFSVVENQDSLKNLNKFSLLNKTINHYLIFTFNLLILIFTVFTAAICFGSKMHNKIFHILLIFTGVCLFSFNWTTAIFSYQIFSIGLPTFNFFKAGTYSSILLQFRVPVFAIYFWIKYLKQPN